MPPADDTMAQEKLGDTGVAKRRLLIQLLELGLPSCRGTSPTTGLGFDMKSSYSGDKVMIGHANGIITMDLAESLSDHRERLRVVLGEPYRTMLGHFRHEVGHYYQWILVTEDPLLAECRALFGDERASYSDAIERHYRFGAPDGWEAEYISSYATMHPWEDFAETWAHYLHITCTLSTAAKGAVRLQSDRTHGLIARRHRAAGRLRRRDHRGDPRRLAVDVAAVQPGQPGDGQGRPLPVRARRTGAPQARLRPPARPERRHLTHAASSVSRKRLASAPPR